MEAEITRKGSRKVINGTKISNGTANVKTKHEKKYNINSVDSVIEESKPELYEKVETLIKGEVEKEKDFIPAGLNSEHFQQSQKAEMQAVIEKMIQQNKAIKNREIGALHLKKVRRDKNDFAINFKCAGTDGKYLSGADGMKHSFLEKTKLTENPIRPTFSDKYYKAYKGYKGIVEEGYYSEDKNGEIIIDQHKKTYSIQGPGHLNLFGDYTMNDTEEHILNIGQENIKKIYKEWKKLKPEDRGKIYLNFQGHSRGAVSAHRGAMRLNKWLYDKYSKTKEGKKFLAAIKFREVLYDPVPGKGDYHGINGETDVLLNTADLDLDKYRPLGADAEVTVVQSLHINESASLVMCPQIVKNATRIILTTRNHPNVLERIDESKYEDGFIHHYREGYIHYEFCKEEENKESGRLNYYRSNGINELPHGVFISNNRGILYEINSMDEYNKIVTNGVLKDTGFSFQKLPGQRYDVIKKNVASCLNRCVGEKLEDDISLLGDEVLYGVSATIAVGAAVTACVWVCCEALPIFIVTAAVVAIIALLFSLCKYFRIENKSKVKEENKKIIDSYNKSNFYNLDDTSIQVQRN